MNLYIPYRLAQIISHALPLPFAYCLGMRVADCFWLLDAQGRQAVRANLAQILRYQGTDFTPRALRKMVRENFEFFGKYIVDFFRVSKISPERLRTHVTIENLDYLEQARALERGVILITAHLGNWELGGSIMTAMGHELFAVFQPERAGSVNRLFQTHRASRGIQGIALGAAARNVMRVLKARGMVAMLADRDYSRRHRAIDFFGAPVRLPDGPARLALRTGAPLLPAFVLRRPDDGFLMRVHPPIIPTAHQTVDQIQTRIRDVLEFEVSQNPLQWFMFNKFWDNIKEREHENHPA